MEQRTTVGNRLLAALPPADLDLLVPHFRKVALERDTVLARSGDPVQRIYFPLSGLVAFIMDMPSGETVATAVVGNDGAAGLLSALGPTRSPVTTAVRMAGTALQISPARFQAALRRSNRHKGSGSNADAVAAGPIPACRSLQRAAHGRGALGALVAAGPRSGRWRRPAADAGDALRIAGRTQADGDACRSQAARVGCDPSNRRSSYRDRPAAARSGGMRVLPAHAPEDRADQLAEECICPTRTAGGRSPPASSAVCQDR